MSSDEHKSYDERLQRALRQRIIMLNEKIKDNHVEGEYVVCGNSATHYTVSVGTKPTCTCPDFVYRRNRCKHIFFVLVNVLGMRRQMTMSSSFRSQDLKHYFRERIEKINSSVIKVFEDDVIEVDLDDAKHADVLRKPFHEYDCPICLEPMDEEKECIIFCEKTCGNNMHTICVERWSQHCGKWECPLCRSKWDEVDK